MQLIVAAVNAASVVVTVADKPAGSKAKTSINSNFVQKVQTGRLVSELIPILAAYPERQVSCTFAASHASADLVDSN